MERSDFNFVGMKVEMQPLMQEAANDGKQSRQLVAIVKEYNKVIGVSNVVLYSNILLHKLIKRVHVDIGEQLRGEVADGEASSLKKIGSIGEKAVHDDAKQAYHTLVLDASLKNLEQNAVID